MFGLKLAGLPFNIERMEVQSNIDSRRGKRGFKIIVYVIKIQIEPQT